MNFVLEASFTLAWASEDDCEGYTRGVLSRLSVLSVCARPRPSSWTRRTVGPAVALRLPVSPEAGAPFRLKRKPHSVRRGNRGATSTSPGTLSVAEAPHLCPFPLTHGAKQSGLSWIQALPSTVFQGFSRKTPWARSGRRSARVLLDTHALK